MPTCKVCQRADALALGRALRRAQAREPGAETLSAISERLGIHKRDLIHHRDHCGGPDDDDMDHAGLSDGPAHGMGSATRPFIQEEKPSKRPSVDRVDRPGVHGASPAVDDRLRVDAERIRTLALAVASGQWKGYGNAVGQAEKWGVEPAEVLRLHRVAVAHVAAARGPRAAQLEAAVGWLTWLREEQTKLATFYEQEAAALFKAQKTEGGTGAPARNAKRLASNAQLVALQAQKQIDRITLGLPTALSINLSVNTSPDFAAVWDIAARIFEALSPGSAEVAERGIAIYEQGGEAAFEEWLAVLRSGVLELDA